jgi:pyruvate kinase
MRRRRRVKILATLGPASSSPERIRQLFLAGADVFRLNMSHGSHADVRRYHAAIRRIEREIGRPIGILVDLQGPKLRIGELEDGEVVLKAGGRFRLDLDPKPGSRRRAPLPHREVFSALQPGTRILLDDGKIALHVEEVGPDHADTVVDVGGVLKQKKGVNVPNARLPLSALSAKDRSDLEFAANLGVDWVAFSFIPRVEDVAEGRKLLAGRAALLAKIEKPSAVEELDAILELSDGIMVARGDLGVELPVELVPSLQKRITRVARNAGKPVVIATQMRESMITNPMPTRAEVSDVATAVYDGADAVMLSAESAAGQYPVEAVAMMNRTAESVEADPNYRALIDAQHAGPEPTAADAISLAAREVAATVRAAAIVCYTSSGSTGLRAARERPPVPVLALTPKIETGRRLALVWGLHCVHTEDAQDIQDMVDRACTVAADEDFAQGGDRVVITAGLPFGTPGATNLLRIAWVPVSAQNLG